MQPVRRLEPDPLFFTCAPGLMCLMETIQIFFLKYIVSGHMFRQANIWDKGNVLFRFLFG